MISRFSAYKLLFLFSTLLLFNVAISAEDSPAGAAPQTVSAPEVIEAAVLPPTNSPELPASLRKLYNIKTAFQFGYDFFENVPQQLSGAGVSRDYQLRPGDRLVIYFWGDLLELVLPDLDPVYPIEVDSSGSIFIPKTGPLSVAGMTLGSLQAELNKSFSSRYKNISIRVALNNSSSIPVYVSGRVRNPGRQLVHTGHSLVDAVLAAGGIKQEGSLRNISLNRRSADGKTDKTRIDLYDLLVHGRPLTLGLRENDVILVPPLSSTVYLKGAVQTEGIFEIDGDTTLSNLLEYSGGFLSSADTGRLYIDRYGNGSKESLTVDLAKENPLLKDGDVINVYTYLMQNRKSVEIRGNVSSKGKYAWEKEMTLSKIVKQSPDVFTEAFQPRAEISRVNTASRKRFVTTFDVNAFIKGEDDPALLPDDIITFYAMQPYADVEIGGEVVNPGLYPYFPGMDINDVVQYAELKGRVESLRADIYQGSNLIYSIRLSSINIESNVYSNLIPEGSRVRIRKVEKAESGNEVSLFGRISAQGEYRIRSNETLGQLLERAGGLESDAYIDGIVFLRRSVAIIQKKNLEAVLLSLEKQLLEANNTQAADASQVAVLQMFYENEQRKLENMRKQVEMIDGRITLKDLDIVLEDGDSIYIPRRSDVVMVMGQVRSQSVLSFQVGKSSDYYLDQVGGVLKQSRKRDIYTIRADGSIVSRSLRKKIEPGATIVVPPRIKVPRFFLQNLKDITQILANLSSTYMMVRLAVRAN